MSTSVNANELSPHYRTKALAEGGTGADKPSISYSAAAGRLSALMQMIADGLGDGLLIAVLIATGLVCLVVGAIYCSSLAGPVLENFGQFFVG
jgi:hypothetical protein